MFSIYYVFLSLLSSFLLVGVDSFSYIGLELRLTVSVLLMNFPGLLTSVFKFTFFHQSLKLISVYIILLLETLSFILISFHQSYIRFI